ncbi:Lysophospholipase, alpha-beta hydrolase superfamily [Luteibacter sp. UNCMF331Sha3.1]|uniref:alpha/beta hydrolase n=1 Tax=Luteibacter sp. UNCMF331Sha3.1 TaxID=1502760 RepID=UPI0008BF4D0B|nr:alpha/beta fold hydrolase [Luteibacter sp. UNCMF331Sha3.1]SEM36099.1 Lysophospholipase, alpha-beta hydrolase superfamily [Luteibacter sp. UNCMF331Sha3.1]
MRAPSGLDAVAARIAEDERAVPDLKPDNEARIVFRGAAPYERRRLSVVYVHGFTASQAEGAPAHRAIADACDAHLFLNRLTGHGSTAPGAMAGITPERWRADADEALDVGLALGERVVLVATSMGASLALDLAVRRPEAIAAIVAWSPGIRVHDADQLRAAVLMQGAVEPPGERSPFQRRYWSSVVHTDAYRAIAHLFIEWMRPERLSAIACPVFFGVWDGGDGDRDTLTSVRAMRDAFEWLGTPAERRRLVAYDQAAHVLASPERSPAAGRVLADSLAFLRDAGLAR